VVVRKSAWLIFHPLQSAICFLRSSLASTTEKGLSASDCSTIDGTDRAASNKDYLEHVGGKPLRAAGKEGWRLEPGCCRFQTTCHFPSP